MLKEFDQFMLNLAFIKFLVQLGDELVGTWNHSVMYITLH